MLKNMFNNFMDFMEKHSNLITELEDVRVNGKTAEDREVEFINPKLTLIVYEDDLFTPDTLMQHFKTIFGKEVIDAINPEDENFVKVDDEVGLKAFQVYFKLFTNSILETGMDEDFAPSFLKKLDEEKAIYFDIKNMKKRVLRVKDKEAEKPEFETVEESKLTREELKETINELINWDKEKEGVFHL